MTPEDVHFDRADEVVVRRQQALDEAFKYHPERFPKGRPIAKALPRAVYINPPEKPAISNDQEFTN